MPVWALTRSGMAQDVARTMDNVPCRVADAGTDVLGFQVGEVGIGFRPLLVSFLLRRK